MKGLRYLAKNVGLLTISQFGTKLLSFFLVPLYTNVLSTTEYGTYDLLNSTVSLLIPILTLSIGESVLLFSLEKNNDKKTVCTIGIVHFAIGAIIVGLGILLNYLFGIFTIINDFALEFFMLYVSISLNGIITNFARGLDKIKEIAISGIICSIIMLSLNIIFLVPLKLGLYGYFMANIIGVFSQTLYLFLVMKAWNYISIKMFESKKQKEMLGYSRPLIINNISWWINNVSDRYIVTWICGIAVNGIYSVSYKIPSILTIFQGIFNQAWTLSAVKEFDKEDRNGFFSNMYNSYNAFITIICALLIATTKILAKLLYGKEFYTAWKYVPFLLISIVFGALSGYVGGIFAAVKDSKVIAKSTFISSTINILLNIILVYKIGVVGAAISTCISYFLVWIMRIIYVRKYISLKVNILRDVISYFLLILQSIGLIMINNLLISCFFQLIIIFIEFTLYRKIVANAINLVLNKARNKIILH